MNELEKKNLPFPFLFPSMTSEKAEKLLHKKCVMESECENEATLYISYRCVYIHIYMHTHTHTHLEART